MSWKPGDQVNSPVNEMVPLDPDTMDVAPIYKTMLNTILPRPIAFVSTINKKGETNLSPFSFFNGVSSHPPVLMVSIAVNKDSTKKDTLRNIEETGQFVVNTASEWLVEPLVYSSGDFQYGESEFDVTGLTPIPSVKVVAPRCKESAVHFECETYKTVSIGDGTPGSVTVVFGKILLIHIMKEAYENGRIHWKKLAPMSRVGGLEYGTVGKTVSLEVPRIKK